MLSLWAISDYQQKHWKPWQLEQGHVADRRKDGYKILKRTYRKEEVTRQAVECVKRQEVVEDIHPCSSIVGNLRVMTDGPEEETAPQTGKLCSWISSSICHCECSSSVGPRLCTSSKLSTSFASVTKQMKDRTFIYPCTQ